MTATQLPKPGDRFRWRHGIDTARYSRAVVAVTDRFVHAELECDPGRPVGPYANDHWLREAIPIPPKPHVEPVQWGIVWGSGRFCGHASESDARRAVAFTGGRTLAKLDHGVLFVEVGGEFVTAFGGAG